MDELAKTESGFVRTTLGRFTVRREDIDGMQIHEYPSASFEDVLPWDPIRGLDERD
jgi:hypothetical protein